MRDRRAETEAAETIVPRPEGETDALLILPDRCNRIAVTRSARDTRWDHRKDEATRFTPINRGSSV